MPCRVVLHGRGTEGALPGQVLVSAWCKRIGHMPCGLQACALIRFATRASSIGGALTPSSLCFAARSLFLPHSRNDEMPVLLQVSDPCQQGGLH